MSGTLPGAQSRWLLRSSQKPGYVLQGPMSRDEVIQAIQGGKVALQDEACASGGYWFSFHESEELAKQLGISWTQVRKDGQAGDSTVHSDTTDGADESTEETDTQTETDREIELRRPRHKPASQAANSVEHLQVWGAEIPAWIWAVAAVVAVALLLRLSR